MLDLGDVICHTYLVPPVENLKITFENLKKPQMAEMSFNETKDYDP